ncbi:hypothetical protein AVEN_117127-1, partial [Araneus ventricosus]
RLQQPDLKCSLAKFQRFSNRGQQCPSGKVSAPGPKPDSTGDPPCMDLLHAKSYIRGQTYLPGVVRKFGERVPAQVSSPSSALGTK